MDEGHDNLRQLATDQPAAAVAAAGCTEDSEAGAQARARASPRKRGEFAELPAEPTSHPTRVRAPAGQAGGSFEASRVACAAAGSCSPPGAVCAEEALTDTGTATTAGAAKHDDCPAPAVVDEELSDEEEDLTSDERLLRAARWKGVGAIERLLRNRLDAHASDSWGATPLMIAARHRPREITAALLRHGGRGGINARNKLGHTALHEACVADNTGAVAELLEAGADWSVVDKNGETALMAASVNGSFEAAQLLLRESPIEGLCARDNEGNTALHHACHGRWGYMTQLLLDAGSDASALNKHGQWPSDMWTNASNYTAVMAASAAARLEPLRHQRIQRWVRRSLLVLWRSSNHSE
ncbi:hypothetical protein FNF31_07146 [Cafeteria roenbergensis]|uniref:Uncharacterized protein n=1 Tax=Cafeteria roenbergensis TaxID=33653 RepID=A0A5A8CAM8_CAFRO|nr:hypothetical protein FNF31_07146 [Cafeteria roenbergensis]